MKVTIVYDNIICKKGLKADWGFSALIEFEDKKILFDAGANGKILLDNMRKLNIEPKTIDAIFISHNHFDHIGGLSTFLDENNDLTLYSPSTFRGVKNVKKLEYITDSKKLSKNIFTTGELNNIEQSLIIKTEKGLVIIVGCSHPTICNILKSASEFGTPYALIGGMHSFNQFDALNDLEVVCPTHCTKHIKKIKSLFPEKYILGGAGKIIEID